MQYFTESQHISVDFCRKYAKLSTVKQIVAFIAVLVLACSVNSANKAVRLSLGYEADSATVNYRKNGTIVFTNTYVPFQLQETTATYQNTNDTFYQWEWVVYEPGADSVLTVVDEWGKGATGGLWRTNARWNYSTDSVRWTLLTDGSTTATGVETARQSKDTSWTISILHVYDVYLKIYEQGSCDTCDVTPSSWQWSRFTDTTTTTLPTPPASKTAFVTVNVLRSDGQPARNVQVTAQLVRGNLVDSAGNAIDNRIPQYRFTDSSGQATFNCIWSSYLLPATDWVFSVVDLGNTRHRQAIPRETNITINMAQ